MRRKSFFAAAVAAFLVSLSIIGWKPAALALSVGAPDSSAVEKRDETSAKAFFEKYLSSVYEAAGLGQAKLDPQTFRKALTGYMILKKENVLASTVLTIVDFNRASTEKRMWIVDLASNKLLFNTYVAHGQGSGDNQASTFSNVSETHQSSLGFYVTSAIYQGKHGLSMKLKGLDAGFNTNAESRAIVLHGADYVSEDFISRHGRLGRSFGCPAVPASLTPLIIEKVKGKSCLYINGTDVRYNSRFLDETNAISGFETAASI